MAATPEARPSPNRPSRQRQVPTTASSSGTIGGSVYPIGQSMLLSNNGNIHKDLMPRNGSVSDSRGATSEVNQINSVAALTNKHQSLTQLRFNQDSNGHLKFRDHF